MSESERNIFDPKTILETWVRSMSDMSSGRGQAKKEHESHPSQEKAEGQEPWFGKHFEASLTTWKTISSAFSKPETLEAIYKSIGAFPNFFLSMIQPVTTGISSMYGQWLAQFQEIGKISQDIHFDQIEKESLSAFTKLYDAEFRKFLSIPPVGLARQYQEKINKLMDRFNLLQAAMAEFMNIIFQPFENAYIALQKKISEWVDTNQVPDDPKAYYQTWLKFLEKEYMLLFKTPEYLSVQAKTLSATADYQKSRQDLVNDLLHQFSIPTSSDVESVYKDLYELKKRLRKIEKAMAGNRKAVP